MENENIQIKTPDFQKWKETAQKREARTENRLYGLVERKTALTTEQARVSPDNAKAIIEVYTGDEMTARVDNTFNLNLAEMTARAENESDKITGYLLKERLGSLKARLIKKYDGLIFPQEETTITAQH